MNFSNFLSLFAAIFSFGVGLHSWINEISYFPIWGITPTWEAVSITMLVVYGINVAVLAKDLQINDTDNSSPYSYKMSYINSRGEETFIVENQPEIDIECVSELEERMWGRECEDTTHDVYKDVSGSLVLKGHLPPRRTK